MMKNKLVLFWNIIKKMIIQKKGIQMQNESNINLYIENYLNNYLKIKKPEFAVLLSGKWGSGKTYFIENYIEKYTILCSKCTRLKS